MADTNKFAEIIGTCRFCGQMTQLPDPSEWEVQDRDEEATLKCKCMEGQHYRSRAYELNKAKENIGILFAKFPDETCNYLYEAAVAVVDKIVDKAVFKVSDEVTATISIKNSHLAIERKKLEVSVLETT